MEIEKLLMIVFVSFFIGSISGLLMGIASPEYKTMCQQAFQIVATKAKGE